jgi:hypothetical protein
MTFQQRQQVAVFVGLAGIESVLLYKLIASQAEINPTELIVAICIVGILIMLSSNADGLRSISLGKEGFKADLEVLRQKTDENDRAITDLVLSSMGPDAYFNLRKLASGNFGPYKKEHYLGLETELYHLRNLGYIVLNKDKAKSIFDIPESGDQLSDYFQVTASGKNYIELREKRSRQNNG